MPGDDGEPERFRRRRGGALRTDEARMTSFEPDQAAAALHEARQRRAQVVPLACRHRAAHRGGRRGGAACAGASQRAPARPPASRSARPPGGCRSISASAARPPGSWRSATCIAAAPPCGSPTILRPGVECELAVRLARDLPPEHCTPEQAAEAVGDLIAGIEIVENRYGELRRAWHADADRRPGVPRRGGAGRARRAGLAFARYRRPCAAS